MKKCKKWRKMMNTGKMKKFGFTRKILDDFQDFVSECVSRYQPWLKSRSVVQSDSIITCVHTVRARVNMCDTDPAALLRAQNTCVYVTSYLIHSQHGSGAVIVASRKSGTVIESRNTGIETCRLVERRAPSGKRGAGSSGRRWCQACQERAKQSDKWLQSELGIKRGQHLRIRELSTARSTACQQTMSTPEEQMNNGRPAVVRATSAMKREMSLWSKFRMPRRPPHWDHISEPWTSGMSWNQRRQKNRRHRDSTLRSACRCTIYSWWWRHCECHNAGVNEGFAGRIQFGREWEPRFVGLLRNVLSCRRKDDIPTQLPVDEVLTHDGGVASMEFGADGTEAEDAAGNFLLSAGLFALATLTEQQPTWGSASDMWSRIDVMCLSVEWVGAVVNLDVSSPETLAVDGHIDNCAPRAAVKVWPRAGGQKEEVVRKACPRASWRPGCNRARVQSHTDASVGMKHWSQQWSNDEIHKIYAAKSGVQIDRDAGVQGPTLWLQGRWRQRRGGRRSFAEDVGHSEGFVGMSAAPTVVSVRGHVNISSVSGCCSVAGSVKQEPDDDADLDMQECRLHRGIVGSLHYLSIDCCDVHFETNACAKEMKQPTKDSWTRL